MKLKSVELFSCFAFNFNWRRYNVANYREWLQGRGQLFARPETGASN
jgi:hypothetical protein